MAKRIYEESHIRAIAKAIRAKNGSDLSYKTRDMAAAIDALEVSGGVNPAAASFTTYLEGDLNEVVIPASCKKIQGTLWFNTTFSYAGWCKTNRLSVEKGSQLKTIDPINGGIVLQDTGTPRSEFVIDLSNATQMTEIDLDCFNFMRDNVTVILPPSIETIKDKFLIHGSKFKVIFTGIPETIERGVLVHRFTPDSNKLDVSFYVPWSYGEGPNLQVQDGDTIDTTTWTTYYDYTYNPDE